MAAGFLGGAAVVIAQLFGATHALAAPYGSGNVLVSDFNSGNVFEYTPSGAAVQTLTTGQSRATGSAFDGAGNFYVTSWGSNAVSKFDPNGTLLGTFGSGYNANPESISLNMAGNFFVGQAGGTHNILEFNPAGTLVNTFSPAVERQGTDWIDLASDQCTMRYTSEGNSVKQFNVCSNTQLPDFKTGLGSFTYALRQRPNGEVLVADSSQVVRLSSTGVLLQTYTIPGTANSPLFALNLDSNGTSFWTAAITNGGIVAEVDIATGAIQQSWNVPSSQMPAGLAIVGQITAGGPPTVPEVPVAPLLLAVAAGSIGAARFVKRNRPFGPAA